MNSAQIERISSVKSSILDTLSKSSNQVIGLLQPLDKAERKKVIEELQMSKVIGLLQPLDEAERKKVIEELQDNSSCYIITKLFDGLKREDLKNAVQNMPDLFNEEYLAKALAKEERNPFFIEDKLKCLPNFDIKSFCIKFSKFQNPTKHKKLRELEKKLEDAHVAVYDNIISNGSIQDLIEILKGYNITLESFVHELGLTQNSVKSLEDYKIKILEGYKMTLESWVYELDENREERKVTFKSIIEYYLKTASKEEKEELSKKQQLLEFKKTNEEEKDSKNQPLNVDNVSKTEGKEKNGGSQDKLSLSRININDNDIQGKELITKQQLLEFKKINEEKDSKNQSLNVGNVSKTEGKEKNGGSQDEHQEAIKEKNEKCQCIIF